MDTGAAVGTGGSSGELDDTHAARCCHVGIEHLHANKRTVVDTVMPSAFAGGERQARDARRSDWPPDKPHWQVSTGHRCHGALGTVCKIQGQTRTLSRVSEVACNPQTSRPLLLCYVLTMPLMRCTLLVGLGQAVCRNVVSVRQPHPQVWAGEDH